MNTLDKTVSPHIKKINVERQFGYLRVEMNRCGLQRDMKKMCEVVKMTS